MTAPCYKLVHDPFAKPAARPAFGVSGEFSMRTAFIGGGVMGEAMLARAVAAGVLAPADVCVAEPLDDRRAYLASTHGVAVTADAAEAAAGAGLVVIAVKPQQIAPVFETLAGSLDANQTALSIAAGVRLKTLVEGLKHPHVVRVMPNTPGRIGAGMSVWTAASGVSAEGRDAAAALLGALGREWYVDNEAYLDMATAVSGSGPAYVFAFIEALREAGVALGMPREMALVLATETVAGSGRLARESGEDPAALRTSVTSPGGTTAAALAALEEGGFAATIRDAVAAAHRRAIELGGNP